MVIDVIKKSMSVDRWIFQRSDTGPSWRTENRSYVAGIWNEGSGSYLTCWIRSGNMPVIPVSCTCRNCGHGSPVYS